MAKSNSTKITTPFGVVKWANLNKPSAKFVAEGEYDVTLVFKASDPAVQKMVATIQAAAEAGRKAEAEADPKKAKMIMTYNLTPDIQPDRDEEGNEIEDTVVLKAKQKASGTRTDGSAWTATVDLFDSKGKEIPKTVAIGRGSILRASIDLRPYAMPATKSAGVSVKLLGVQVKELKSFARGAEGHGFGAVDDGFEVNADADVFDATETPAEGKAAATEQAATDW